MLKMEDLLAQLEERAIQIVADGENLRIKAANGALSDEMRSALHHHKSDLLEHLNKPQPGSIIPTEDAEAYPASHAQQRLWTLSQMAGASRAYHVLLGLRLRGALDKEALQNALAEVVSRHESLRTCFEQRGEEVVQRVQDDVAPCLEWRDLSQQVVALAQLLQLGTELADRPFDLAEAPLLRGLLVKLGMDEHALFLVFHHIVCDGWSLAIFAQEFSECYNATRQGWRPALPPLTIQYRDFARWEKETIASARMIVHEQYWKQQLGTNSAHFDLPTDYTRPAWRSYKGKLLIRAWDHDLQRALLNLSVNQNASLFMVLSVLVKLLLFRYTGASEITIGTPAAGRTEPVLEKQIGFYLNTLVLRTKVQPDASFRDLLNVVKKTALEAFEHQVWPFDKLVASLGAGSDPSRSPLFDVQVCLQNAGKLVLALTGIETEPLEIENPGSKFDLSFDFVPEESGITLGVRYDTALFTAGRIERMAGHLQELARAVCHDPDVLCSRVNLLTFREARQILEQFQGQPLSVRRLQTFPEHFREVARLNPERMAVRCGITTLSYAELDAWSERAAAYLEALRSSQPAAEQPVMALLMHRCPEMVVWLLAAMKAGFAYVPLDPAYPSQRCVQMTRSSAPAVMVVHEATRRLAQEIVSALEPPVRILDVSEMEETSTCVESPRNAPDASTLAYILYTSGSTGEPKGVEIEHGSLLNLLLSMRELTGFDREDSLLAVTTISFDIAGLELYLPLLCGGVTEIATARAAADGSELAAAIASGKPSFLQATPSTWRMLLAAGWKGCASLNAICGGEALPAELAANLVKICGTVWNMYGPTETTIWSTAGRLNPDHPEIDIGRPIHNTLAYVLSNDRELLPVGIPGELYLGGAGVARGYRGRPEETAQRFFENPFGSGRIYRTGDLVSWNSDGTLQYLGRRDQQVKVRGHRIEIAEVEQALVSAGKVDVAVVVCAKDGADDAALAAFYTHTGPLDADVLRTRLEKLLPAYMIPSIFVHLEKFPLTANGKIDRSALPSLQSAPQRSAFAAPSEALEAEIAGIWASVLEVERLGVRDSFFDLGGHSLKATRIVFKLREKLKAEVTMMDILQTRTVESLAALLRERASKPRQLPQSARIETPAANDETMSTEELEMLLTDDQ